MKDNRLYRIATRQLDPTVLAAAAHLAVPGSVVAGPSAAPWYDLPVSGGVRWLWTGPNGRGTVPDVRLLRDPLRPDDVRRTDGILITGPGRTVGRTAPGAAGPRRRRRFALGRGTARRGSAAHSRDRWLGGQRRDP